MYSKLHNRMPPRPPHTGVHGSPSYRQKVRVPPGYSGSAIVDGEERLPGTAPDEALSVPRRGDGVPEMPTDALPDNRDFGHAPPPEPRFSELEQVSDLPNRDRRPLSVSYESAAASGAVGRPPSLFNIAHFPFGHGLGAEEWLLVGLILLLLHEAADDRGDLDETLLLLGLLLLGG